MNYLLHILKPIYPEEISSVESVKAVGDVSAPVSGIVTAVNELLADSPGIINSSPESEGQYFSRYLVSNLQTYLVLHVLCI